MIHMICILVLMVRLTQGEEYVISRTTATSTNASGLCTLATPPISFSTAIPTIKVGSTYINEDMWVGYAGDQTAFVYRGCARNQKEDRPAQTTADPGRCFSYCTANQSPTNYFGITKEDSTIRQASCLCLQNVPEDLYGDCYYKCESPANTPCGGKRQTYVSVYEKVTLPETYRSEDPDGSCLCYDPYARYLLWKDCGSYFRSLCHDGNGTQTSGTYVGTWLRVMNECLRNGTYPVGPFFNFASVPQEGDFYWIGAIKSFSIYPASDKTFSERSGQQGYIDKNKSLRFEQRTDPIRALCVKGSIVASTTPESESSTTHLTSPLSEGTTHSATSSVRQSTPSTTVITSAATTPYADGSGENANRAGKQDGPNLTAVYVVAPLAVVVLLLAVLLAVFIRRKSIQCHDKSEQPPDYVNASPDNEPSDFPDHNNYETSAHVNNVEHQYAAMDHGQDNAAAVYENEDKEYENTQSKYENVYELN